MGADSTRVAFRRRGDQLRLGRSTNPHFGVHPGPCCWTQSNDPSVAAELPSEFELITGQELIPNSAAGVPFKWHSATDSLTTV